MIPLRRAAILARDVPESIRTALLASTLLFATGACASGGGAHEGGLDRSAAANESSRQGLGTSGPGVPRTAPGASAAQAEESAARRANLRRSVLAARHDQDAAFARRSDDASFLSLYDAPERSDAVKLYLRGRAYALLERLKEAATEFDAAVAADPTNPFPLLGLAGCHAKRNENDRAIVALQKAVRIDPDLSEAHLSLARAFNALNRLDEAITAAETSYRMEEDPARAADLLAELWRRKNAPEKAVAVLREVLAKKPADVALRLRLADLLSKMGKAEESAKELDSIALEGKLPIEQLLAYASVYRQAERFDRAVELLERLLREAPESYWRVQTKGDVEKLHAVTAEEKRIGRRLSYSPSELISIVETHSSAERRLFAVQQLSDFEGSPAILQTFVQALRDRSAPVRAVAIGEVAWRAADDGAESIVCKFSNEDPDPGVRAAACLALGRSPWESAEPALLRALGDQDARVRGAANGALEARCGRILFPDGVEKFTAAQGAAVRDAWDKVLADRRASGKKATPASAPAKDKKP